MERKEKLNPPLNQKNRGLQKRKNKARTLCQTCPSRDEEALRDSPISSTDLRALQQWRTNQARINSIIQDMDALGRSCREESTMDFQPADHSFNLHRPLASIPDVLPLPAVRPAAKPGQKVPSPGWGTKTRSGQCHTETVRQYHIITRRALANANTPPLAFSVAPAYPAAPRERKGLCKTKQKRQRSRIRQRRRPKSRRRHEPMVGQQSEAQARLK